MGKGKPSSSNKKKKKNGKQLNSSKNNLPPPPPNAADLSNLSVEELVTRGEAAVELLKPIEALELYECAANKIEIGNGNESGAHILAVIKERQGEIFAQLGDQAKSRDCFAQSIHVTPVNDERKAGRMLYLAQMLGGKEALAQFSAAVNMLKDNSNAEAHFSNAEAHSMLCAAYCSISELYMTDLCFEEDAEKNCEEALSLATKLDDGCSPNVLQQLANLRLSQQRGEEAVGYMKEVWERVKVPCSQAASTYFMDASSNDADADAVVKGTGASASASKSAEGAFEPDLSAMENLPSFEFRTSTAKLLMESASCLDTSNSDYTLLNNAAVTVLASLIIENDEVVETFFLIGCAFKALFDWGNATLYLRRAGEMLNKCKKVVESEIQAKGFDGGGELQLELEDIDMRLESIEESLEEIEDSKGEDDDEMNDE